MSGVLDNLYNHLPKRSHSYVSGELLVAQMMVGAAGNSRRLCRQWFTSRAPSTHSNTGE